jgi:D-3-phosphoglycerate dehydrogenase / 2-oxoglutarate reductase
MRSRRILITCPPMLGMMSELKDEVSRMGFHAHCPEVIQTLSEDALEGLVPQFDGWIIGDDPATRRVFQAGKHGRLRAAVKWGVGVDNVDFEAAKALGIPLSHTPGMFGREVADIAMGYLIALARETFIIDRGVRANQWPKPRGISLANKTVGVVGFGDIGRHLARRAQAAEMKVVAYDPAFLPTPGLDVTDAVWPIDLEQLDFLVFCCALTKANRHMLSTPVIRKLKPGVRIVNVARGPLIDSEALIECLRSGQIHSAALDVMEVEPLPSDSPLRTFDRCIFGSHNASNTEEAVLATSRRALELLEGHLEES